MKLISSPLSITCHITTNIGMPPYLMRMELLLRVALSFIDYQSKFNLKVDFRDFNLNLLFNTYFNFKLHKWKCFSINYYFKDL